MVTLGGSVFLMSEVTPCRSWGNLPDIVVLVLKLQFEATHVQIDDFLSQLPFKCYLPEVASVGN